MILLKSLRLKGVLLLIASICLEMVTLRSNQDQFKCSPIMYWNRLSLAVRIAPSVTNFKTMLDKYKRISIEKGILNGFWELSEEIFKRTTST